jgi:hypothetical protein
LPDNFEKSTVEAVGAVVSALAAAVVVAAAAVVFAAGVVAALPTVVDGLVAGDVVADLLSEPHAAATIESERIPAITSRCFTGFTYVSP